jgi:hypothetical protein
LDLQKQASKYYWYHSVDLGNGVIIDGDYDYPGISGVAAAFLRSSSSGGVAAVTATDICSFLDWDFVGGDEQREARRKAIGDEQGFTVEHITGRSSLPAG